MILCGTKFLRVLIFAVFAVSSAICKQKFPPEKKITANNFPSKIYFTVAILMVDIEYGIESDSEDEEKYCLEDENTIDNPVDNASSGNVVILDPSPEQSVTSGVDVIVIK